MASVTVPRVRAATREINVQWHRRWSAAVEDAFKEMPYDLLMDRDIVKARWDYTQGKSTQRIGIVECDNEVIGILPIQKGRLRWNLTMETVLPYTRFYVKPGYTDAVL